MKRVVEQWPLRFSDHVAFFSYRWLAWIVAALSLVMPGRHATPRDTGLFMLVGVLNVVATALAQSYVRIARQRPILLALDLIACAAVLWLSGSQTLPFLPYAASALVLPALLFGWRGALVSGAVFVLLDLAGLALLNDELGLALGSAGLFTRALTALAFAATWALVAHLLPCPATTARGRTTPTGTFGASLRPDAAARAAGTARTIRLVERPLSESASAATVNLSSLGPLVLTRPDADQRAEGVRRVLYDLTPTHALSLGAALEQLGAAAGQTGDLAVRVSCSGTPKPLSQAQYSLLLRVAQETLLNVQQHAHAHSALLGLSFEEGAVTLVVQDDGVGLLDGTYERPGLHALRALRYRLAELDGQLTVVESDSGGVTARAMLPLD